MPAGPYRRALGRQMELIRREFLRSLFVQMDETGFKKGRAGTTGYVWIAVISGAIWAVFAPTRAAAVLQKHLGWLLDKAVVAADGLRAYQVLFRYLQRCGLHLPARAEAEAVTGDAGDRPDTSVSNGFTTGSKIWRRRIRSPRCI